MSACSTFRVATGRDLLRWSICFAAILSLHGAVAAALLMKPVEGDTFDSTIAVDVDFTTELIRDAQARDIAPGEEQMQTDAAPPPMEKAELKAEAKVEPAKEPLPAPDEPSRCRHFPQWPNRRSRSIRSRRKSRRKRKKRRRMRRRRYQTQRRP